MNFAIEDFLPLIPKFVLFLTIKITNMNYGYMATYEKQI